MTNLDSSLYWRLKVLSWVSYQHLDIQPMNRLDDMWKVASDEMNNMDNHKTPQGKLDCLFRSMRIMNDVLTLITSNEKAKGVGADEILPIVIYILLKAQPKRFYSNFYFIQNFSREDKLLGDLGY